MRVLLTRPRFLLSKEGVSIHPKLFPQAKCPWLFGLNGVGQYFPPFGVVLPPRGRVMHPHRATTQGQAHGNTLTLLLACFGDNRIVFFATRAPAQTIRYVRQPEARVTALALQQSPEGLVHRSLPR